MPPTRLHAAPIALAVAVLIAHVAVNALTPYGFHRDEFLYLAMARHLRLWSMDFPPFIALAGRATLATLGGSLVAVRLLPALAAALLVLAAAFVARRLGGGPLAQTTAALAVAFAPLFLRAGNLFQPVVFDQLWWTLALIALLRLPGPPRAWLLLGAALGVGLLTKFSIAFVGVGIVAGILATPLRRSLLGPWPWVALLLALAIGSPSVVGQLRLDWPVVGQMADLRSTQLERIGPVEFVGGQVGMLGPVLLLAVLGAIELLRRDRTAGERATGWAIVATFVLLMALRGKAYYVGPIYPTLFAAGAVLLERMADRARVSGRRTVAAMLRWAPIAVIVLPGLVAVPYGVPVLPPPAMARYASALGMAEETNVGEPIPIPQDYADMLGWEAQVAATARAYRSLAPWERADVVVIGTNYGRAGAHDHLGVPLGMPPAVAPVGSYWFFGPGEKPGRVAIVIGGEREVLERFFESVIPAERLTDEWRVPEERDVTIWIARRPRRTLQEIWPELAGRN